MIACGASLDIVVFLPLVLSLSCPVRFSLASPFLPGFLLLPLSFFLPLLSSPLLLSTAGLNRPMD